jgi:hypothetical protein
MIPIPKQLRLNAGSVTPAANLVNQTTEYFTLNFGEVTSTTPILVTFTADFTTQYDPVQSQFTSFSAYFDSIDCSGKMFCIAQIYSFFQGIAIKSYSVFQAYPALTYFSNIGHLVWHDVNGDGIVNTTGSAEPGIAGVTVNLILNGAGMY